MDDAPPQQPSGASERHATDDAPPQPQQASERRVWSADEDVQIVALVSEHGTRAWSVIAAQLPTRTGNVVGQLIVSLSQHDEALYHVPVNALGVSADGEPVALIQPLTFLAGVGSFLDAAPPPLAAMLAARAQAERQASLLRAGERVSRERKARGSMVEVMWGLRSCTECSLLYRLWGC